MTQRFASVIRLLPEKETVVRTGVLQVGADMAAIAADPTTRRWGELTDPCQRPVEAADGAQWWAAAEEVFHLD